MNWNNTLARIYFGACLLMLPGIYYAGGGWVRSKGSSYWKLSQSGVSSDGYFAGTLGFSSTLSSSILTTAFYFESGLGERLSLEGYLPFYVNHSVEGTVVQNGLTISESDKLGGVGDLNFGLRYQLLRKEFLVISTSLTASFASGIIRGGFRNNLFTGDGEFNHISRIDLSVPYGTKKLNGYSTVYLGTNIRQSPFDNEWLYGFESGISNSNSQMWLIAKIASVSSYSISQNTIDLEGYTNSQTFTSFEIETAFYISEQIGLSSAYKGTLNKKVLLISPMLNIGLFYDVR